MATYSDYFALRDGYYAVIGKENIQDPKNRWQDTYPHKTFVELLKKAARMLERADNSSKKPIWIHGMYGTGKSRIAWTLRELLKCSASELNEYFDDYRELKDESELRQKLLGLKNGKPIVIAMRYASGEIDSLDDLIMAVYQSVCGALEDRGMNLLAEKSLEGGILRWLDDELNQKILTQIVNAEPYARNGNLPKSGEEIRQRLMQPGEHGALLRDLMDIGRERNILTFNFDMDSLCEWLKEVIQLNGLGALILIWDEFSDFIAKNRGIYGSLQQLAELSAGTPFYLVLVTHSTANLFTSQDLDNRGSAANVMMERFQQQLIELPDYTAFKLIGHALKVKDGLEQEWGGLRDDLNDRLEEARREVARHVPELNVDDFKDILPIHPFTALILKNVAHLFDANQRSMFEFIAAEDEDAHAFQWFIKKYGPQDKMLLSIDQLWDYFYITGKGKLGTGRDNLESHARAILDAYPVIAEKYSGSNENGESVDTDKQRVLKTVILLQALRRVSPHTEFFKATKDILEIAFEGIDTLENGAGLILADDLVRQKDLFIDNDIYQVQLGNAVDQSVILRYKEDILKTTTTASLIAGFEPQEILPLTDALKTRFSIRKTTSSNFKRDLNGLIAQESTPWGIKMLMLFARDSREYDDLQRQLKEALADPRANNIYFIDAAAIGLDEEALNEYGLARARQRYFTAKDTAQANQHAQTAESILRKWRTAIAGGKFAIFSSRFPNGRSSSHADDFVDKLKSLVLELYPQSCDFRPGVVDTHFRMPNKTAIRAAIDGAYGGSITKQQSEQLLQDVRMEKYWEKIPDHPLSALKNRLEKMTKRTFAPDGKGRISIAEIIDDFMERGFMPTLLSAYLSAYLLKEYAAPLFRYSDGDTGDVMTADKLEEMISLYFKKLNGTNPHYRAQYIEVLTEEQRAFAELAQAVFHLDINDSLERIAARIGEIVRNWGYPIWVLHSLPQVESIRNFVTFFAQMLNPVANGAGSHGDVATQAGKLFLSNRDVQNDLCALFTQENMEKGMRAWLEEFAGGEFWRLADEIHVEDPLRDVRGSFGHDGTWLWSQKTGQDAIARLLKEYRFAAQSVRQGFLTHARSFSEALEGWRQKLLRIHVPVAVLKERYPEQKVLLNNLRELAKTRLLPPGSDERLLQAMTDNPDRLRDFFENSYNVFKSVYANLLEALPESNKKELYERLPATSFFDDRDYFEKELKVKTEEIAGKLKHGRLCVLWKEKTGSESPAELSRSIGVPLKAIIWDILKQEYWPKAVKALDAINNVNASENDIENALSFWQANMSSLSQIVAPGVAESAFRKQIIGDAASLLQNLVQVQTVLRDKLGNDVYTWLDHPQWREIVRQLAAEEYKNHGRDAVVKKVEQMDGETARRLLLQLGRNDYEIGIKILAE